MGSISSTTGSTMEVRMKKTSPPSPDDTWSSPKRAPSIPQRYPCSVEGTTPLPSTHQKQIVTTSAISVISANDLNLEYIRSSKLIFFLFFYCTILYITACYYIIYRYVFFVISFIFHCILLHKKRDQS